MEKASGETIKATWEPQLTLLLQSAASSRIEESRTRQMKYGCGHVDGEHAESGIWLAKDERCGPDERGKDCAGCSYYGECSSLSESLQGDTPIAQCFVVVVC